MRVFSMISQTRKRIWKSTTVSEKCRGRFSCTTRYPSILLIDRHARIFSSLLQLLKPPPTAAGKYYSPYALPRRRLPKTVKVQATETSTTFLPIGTFGWSELLSPDRKLIEGLCFHLLESCIQICVVTGMPTQWAQPFLQGKYGYMWVGSWAERCDSVGFLVSVAWQPILQAKAVSTPRHPGGGTGRNMGLA